MRDRFLQNNPPHALEAAVVFAVFGLVYVATAARALLGSDSGLFAVIFADGGYAHPPGYPLYSAYLRAMSWLPADVPAHGASVATAFVGAGAVAMLYAAARRWGLRRTAALFGAAAFGLAPHVWVYHTQPEVFALNHLLVAAIFWAAAPGAPVRGFRRVLLLGLLAGLGLSHHHPIVLTAPVGLWGVYQGLRETERGPLFTLAGGVGALAAGLLPYTYLVVVEHWDLGWHWRSPNSLRDVMRMFLRRDYGTFQLKPDESTYRPLAQVWFWGRSVARDLYVVPAVAAIVGAVAGCAGHFSRSARRGRPTTVFSICALVALVASGPWFASLLPREPEGVSYIFLRRFHLFSELQIAFFAALGAEVALERWVRVRVGLVAIAALVAAAIFVGGGELRMRHDPAVEHYIQNTFTPLEEDAVVVGMGDHHFFGALYLQRGLGVRRDIDYVGMALFDAEWYRHRVYRRLEIDRSDGGRSFDDHRFFSKILGTGRPLYVTGAYREGVLDGWTVAPYGTLLRVFPQGVHQPPVDEIYATNRRLYEAFDISAEPPPPPRSWRRYILRQYARTWRDMADGFESVGRDDLAEKARAAAVAYAPWWEPDREKQ